MRTKRTLQWLLLCGLFGCGSDTSQPIVQNTPIQTAVLSVSDGPIYDFGGRQVGNVATKAFTVSNIGVLNASQLSGSFYLSDAFRFVGGTYPGTGGTCGVVLAPNAFCSVTVEFAPTYASSFQDAIHISYFNGREAATTSEPIIKGSAFP